jgi:hypothetical protein
MSATASPRWQVKGTITLACNCDWGCPCNFGARPTQGHCEGGWTWHVADGRFGETPLRGLHFTLLGDWPGAIHEGNGEGLVLIDDRASEAQRAAILTLLGGGVGGPWSILRNTLARVHGPHFVPYAVELRGLQSMVRAGDKLQLELTAMRNPVTRAEVHPRIQLPEGFVWKDGAVAVSRLFAVHDGIRYEHPGKYAAIADFEYTGPPAARP